MSQKSFEGMVVHQSALPLFLRATRDPHGFKPERKEQMSSALKCFLIDFPETNGGKRTHQMIRSFSSR